MSQTIDLSTVGSATFNGTDLGEIKLNGTSCWSGSPFSSVDSSWTLTYDSYTDGHASYGHALMARGAPGETVVSFNSGTPTYPSVITHDVYGNIHYQQYQEVAYGGWGPISTNPWYATLIVTNPPQYGFDSLVSAIRVGRNTDGTYINGSIGGWYNQPWPYVWYPLVAAPLPSQNFAFLANFSDGTSVQWISNGYNTYNGSNSITSDHTIYDASTETFQNKIASGLQAQIYLKMV